MSNTKRRVRALKSASTRATLQRRAAGARAAKAPCAQATPPPDSSDASARTGARFIVIERTDFDRRDDAADGPFAVVEAATRQTPENFFGRDWQGNHPTRESAETEAEELNALAGHFLCATTPATAPAAPAPMSVPGPVLGDKPTARAAELLAPTQEMPVIRAEDLEPLDLPGAATLRSAVDEIALAAPAGESTGQRYARILRGACWRPPVAPAELDDPSAQAFEAALEKDGESTGELASATRKPTDSGRWQEYYDIARRIIQRPRIVDAANAGQHVREGYSSPVIPGLHRALIHEIRAGQQVLCTDGAWRPTQGGSLRGGVAVLVMADLTEHAFSPTLRFWVREPASDLLAFYLDRPECPNGCFRTQADFRLCTCSFGCGCAPHPAPRAAAHGIADTRELHLTGAVA